MHHMTMMESSIGCPCPKLNADESFNQINFNGNFTLKYYADVISRTGELHFT